MYNILPWVTKANYTSHSGGFGRFRRALSDLMTPVRPFSQGKIQPVSLWASSHSWNSVTDAALKARVREHGIGPWWCNVPDECIRLLLLLLFLHVQATGQAAWAHTSLGKKKKGRGGHLSFLSSPLTNEMGLSYFFHNTWENKSSALLDCILSKNWVFSKAPI